MPGTRAAEGLDRLAFSIADLDVMTAAGILEAGERLELIGGDLVPMAVKSEGEERLEAEIARCWARAAACDGTYARGSALRLAKRFSLVPDLVVFEPTKDPSHATGPDILLAVEITEAAIDYDLRFKPPIYASFGLRELWVIDVARRVVHRHLDPRSSGYLDIREMSATDRVMPAFAPAAFALALADLGRDDLARRDHPGAAPPGPPSRPLA